MTDLLFSGRRSHWRGSGTRLAGFCVYPMISLFFSLACSCSPPILLLFAHYIAQGCRAWHHGVVDGVHDPSFFLLFYTLSITSIMTAIGFPLWVHRCHIPALTVTYTFYPFLSVTWFRPGRGIQFSFPWLFDTCMSLIDHNVKLITFNWQMTI